MLYIFSLQMEEISWEESPSPVFLWIQVNAGALVLTCKTAKKLFKNCILLHGLWQKVWIVPYQPVLQNAHLRNVCTSKTPFGVMELSFIGPKIVASGIIT